MSAIATQQSPFPEALQSLVERLEYRPGWQFFLEHVDRGQGSEGLTLKILTVGYDTYHPDPMGREPDPTCPLTTGAVHA